jgi:hypothetical protein
MTRDETINYLRDKAAQCRRLAAGIWNQSDRAVAALLDLALEFEAKVAAVKADNTTETTIAQLPSDPTEPTPPKSDIPRE